MTHSLPTGAEFPVVEVAIGSQFLDEPMGTKKKFWCHDPDGRRWLFKFSRANTGEHWSEKLASEIAARLGIPAAHVELARCGDAPGCAGQTFVGDRDELVHGNELLQQLDASYPVHEVRGVSKHSVDAVLRRLGVVAPPPHTSEPTLPSAADWFVGYLLLDALILNTDRHHQNWGVLAGEDGTSRLAPSFDHASSLGRELTDEAREARLRGPDSQRTVGTYVARARSALFRGEHDTKPLHPVDAFAVAAATLPAAGAFWVERLRSLGQDDLEVLVHALPNSVVSAPARAFALALLVETRARLERWEP